ncbi:hypothetical protein [Streptomyces lavendulae]|uniref:hypothetical protein n=1 Tax=Streptomyces lavendulae TaxID=1914 RepID=UPI0033D1116C
MTGRPCDIPNADHDGTARLYPSGWRCISHAPQARTTGPAASTSTAPPVRHPARPVVELRATGALRIDCGQGIEIKDGDRAGQIWWKTQPRARYECVACHWESETVTGPEAVKGFTARIRTSHRATCPGAPAQGAQAA